MQNYQLAQAILPRINTSHYLLSLVSKFIKKLASKRDWSATEINHILLNLPL